MTISLFNKDGEVVPPRPTPNQQTITTAVKRCTHKCRTIHSLTESELSKFALDLGAFWETDKDAYLIAKQMESIGYAVDTQFVIDLKAIIVEIPNAQMLNEVNWYASHKPVPPLPKGSKLELEIDGEMRTVTILDVLELSPAAYGVEIFGRSGLGSRRVCSFEEILEASIKSKPSMENPKS